MTITTQTTTMAAQSMLVQIGSEMDTKSFMVPCYGFNDPAAGAAYAEGETEYRNRIFENNPIYDRGTEFAPLYQGRAYYVPRNGARRCAEWFVPELMTHNLHKLQDKAAWRVLRAQTTPTPSGGAYNVALLVAGRRRFPLPYQDPRNAPKWWRRLSSGERDCFAEWAHTDGRRFSNVVTSAANATRIYASRSALGVLYARTTTFNLYGNPSGFRTEIICLEFAILDHNPARDNVIKVQIAAQLNVEGEPSLSGLDDIWKKLIISARAGFEDHCLPVPPATEEWRKFFLEQRDKADAERNKYIAAIGQYVSGPSFHRDIRDMTWQQALDLVQEPWQLQLIIEVHCNARFDETPNRYDSTGTRVRRMLEMYDCTPERRAQLDQMIADYVEPADELWNYTGD
jgi:hypothetical protein